MNLIFLLVHYLSQKVLPKTGPAQHDIHYWLGNDTNKVFLIILLAIEAENQLLDIMSADVGVAGGGGVIRNEERHWIRGFPRNIGTTTSLLTENLAFRDGLNLCISMNLEAVEIGVDAKAIVDLIANGNNSDPFISPLIDDCKTLPSWIPHKKIGHCFKEANKCADALAKIGTSLLVDFVLFMPLP
ncbi:hypothetical protein SO802_019743 [Lithocarpus litseifolius]|uniref:RNase H type-1 domain-containing protein n=1 Tax=Lithocarpus litseifolius TaxID=425828 RepID=A0AAW2CUI1_9ROSI